MLDDKLATGFATQCPGQRPRFAGTTIQDVRFARRQRLAAAASPPLIKLDPRTGEMKEWVTRTRRHVHEV